MEMRSRRDAVCRETRDPTRSDPQSHRERADELMAVVRASDSQAVARVRSCGSVLPGQPTRRVLPSGHAHSCADRYLPFSISGLIDVKRRDRITQVGSADVVERQMLEGSRSQMELADTSRGSRRASDVHHGRKQT